MIVTQARKNKVDLSDYDFKRDIQNRLFLSHLCPFELEVLRELIDNSLKTSIDRLAEDLEVNEEVLMPAIEKIQESGLIEVDGRKIAVNKEMRKYYETHLEKFEEDFHPTLRFLHNLLNKVPIHILPLWYAIPRSTDHIFKSIVEKYMIDPKTYNHYLDELTFETPELNSIYNEVYAAPGFTVSTQFVMKKYSLSREQLTEFALELEYNLACCLCYQKNKEGGYEEVLTPFHEWKEHLCFQLGSRPKSIEKDEEIERYHPEDFGFVQDLTRIVHTLENAPLSLISTQEGWMLSPETAREILPHFVELASPDIHVKNLICMSTQLKLGTVEGKTLVLGSQTEEWLKSSPSEQALIVYRQPSRTFRLLDRKGVPHSDRDIRETEKNMKRIARSGWIYYDDFLRGFTAPIGSAEPVKLVNKGIKWKYSRPEYTEDDLLLLEAIVFGHLFETGIITIGTHQDKRCLCVTPFGQQILLGE